MAESESTLLEEFIRQQSRTLNLSLTEVCRRAGIGRQTLYELWGMRKQYPSLHTVAAVAAALEVHPLLLLRYLFAEAPAEDASPLAGDRSSFVRDVSYADNTPVLINEPLRKIWSIQNVGTVPWSGRRMRCMDETLEVFTREGESLRVAPPLQPVTEEVPVPDTEPGETVEVTADFVAPPTPGTVISYWKMVDAEGRLCFPDSTGLWVRVQVIAPTSGAEGEEDP
ncbi:NBR1-Ig-like domain-containing protein [Thiohalospira sp.]|uniref:NBR1-Ig-like domain-containing protein n=1 Tax=Thiohalospira sp. TaxID=3080549 RepID=UPI00398168D1